MVSTSSTRRHGRASKDGQFHLARPVLDEEAMTRTFTVAALWIAGVFACVPPQSASTSSPGDPSTAAGGQESDLASAICNHLDGCGLVSDMPGCVREFSGYDSSATSSLLQRDCDELAELKAGRVPGGGGGGGGACAANGTNDCGAGRMCCAAGGGAAMQGVPGQCQSVAVCTGPYR